MSVKVSDWVWKHSRHRGALKTLLLALADFANDSGIAWPSVATLAARINETERYTRDLVAQLVDSGDLLRVVGGGRGHPTRYAVAVGLTPRQREKLNTALQNSVSQNSVSQNTVLQNTVPENTVHEDDATETLHYSDRNPALQRPETLHYSDRGDTANTASGRAEPAQNAGEIRHDDPSCDPSDPLVATQPRPRRGRTAGDRKKEPTDHQALMAGYQDWLGYKIPHGPKEAAAAKRLLAAGYTVAQVDEAYHALKAQTFYANKHISLQIVHEQIGALLTASPQGAPHDRQTPGRPTAPRRPASAAIPAAVDPDGPSIEDRILAYTDAAVAAYRAGGSHE